MIASYILALLGILSLLFIVVDGFISLNEWQQRIHIGRWDNRLLWQQAIEQKALKWLKKTPTVKIKDQGRLILWDMLTGKYRSKTIQSWQDAGLLFGMEKEVVLTYLKSHSQLFDKESLPVDYALMAYVLKKKGVLPQEDEKRLKDVFKPFNSGEQTLPYRLYLPSIRFVDSLGLICPFLAISGMSDLATRQISEFDPILYANVYPPHAFDRTTGLPLGIYDWSRGIGWYILALTEASDLPGNKERLVKLAKQLLPFQKENGGFGCMIFNPTSQFESSGSALIGLLFVKAFELTDEKDYLAAAFVVEKSLMSATRRNGAVDYAQGDTKSIGYYSTTFSIMPFAQGMALYLSKRLNSYTQLV